MEATQKQDDVQLWLEYWEQVRGEEARAATPARSYQPHPDQVSRSGGLDPADAMRELDRFRFLASFIFEDVVKSVGRHDPQEVVFATRLLCNCAYYNTRIVLCSSKRAQEILKRGEETARRVSMGVHMCALFEIHAGHGRHPTQYVLRPDIALQMQITGSTAREVV